MNAPRSHLMRMIVYALFVVAALFALVAIADVLSLDFTGQHVLIGARP